MQFEEGKTYTLSGGENPTSPILGAIKESKILWFLGGGLVAGLLIYSVYAKKRKKK